MKRTAPQTNCFQEGLNDPSPITRVLALDWYDGPIEGVMEVGQGGPVFRFRLLDERQREQAADEQRVFGLYPLADNALTELVAILEAYGSPRWPVWFPVWEFPSDEAGVAADAKTDAILSQSGPLTWVLVGDVGSGAVRALPVQLAQAS